MTNVWSLYCESRSNDNGEIDLITKYDLLMHLRPLENQFLGLDFSNKNHSETIKKTSDIKFYQLNWSNEETQSRVFYDMLQLENWRTVSPKEILYKDWPLSEPLEPMWTNSI